VFQRGTDEVRAGQIAHLDQNRTNPTFDNLVYLCLEHHDQYDSRTSQSKGLTEHEVRVLRTRLYAMAQQSALMQPDQHIDQLLVQVHAQKSEAPAESVLVNREHQAHPSSPHSLAVAPSVIHPRVLAGHRGNINALVALAEGYAISASADCTMRKWNLETGCEELCFAGHEKPVNAIALSGPLILSASADGHLGLWNVQSGHLVSMLRGHTAPINWVASLYDRVGAITASADGTLRVWDLPAGRCRHILNGHTQPVNCVTLTNDNRAVSASADATLRLWDLTTGLCIAEMKGHTAPVNFVVTVDRIAISAGADGTIRSWSTKNGATLGGMRVHGAPINRLAITTDHQNVITASNDGTLAICSVQGNQLIHRLEGHEGSVYDVITNEHHQMLSASGDHTIGVWNIETGRLVAFLRGHNAGVIRLQMCAGGRSAISGSNDKSVMIWDLPKS
jgi:WD40 repeat protein